MPTDIEVHMISHPAIADVAVIGLPDEVDGERPLAFVKLKPGATVTADELIQYTNGINLFNSLPIIFTFTTYSSTVAYLTNLIGNLRSFCVYRVFLKILGH